MTTLSTISYIIRYRGKNKTTPTVWSNKTCDHTSIKRGVVAKYFSFDKDDSNLILSDFPTCAMYLYQTWTNGPVNNDPHKKKVVMRRIFNNVVKKIMISVDSAVFGSISLLLTLLLE